jgi:aspartate aminotransferase
MISKSIAERMDKGSWIRKMFEEGGRLKALYGAENVFDFSLGNPDLEPPVEVLNAIRELAADPTPGLHGYMSNAGYLSTRQAVAGLVSRRSGLDVPASAVCMTVGAGGALNVALKAILNPGDEVIILAPYFFEYTSYTGNHNGVPVIVSCDRETLLPDFDAIRRAITPRTKALILNSPNNPSGVIYPAESLIQLDALLKEAPRTIYVLSDEPYNELVFDNQAVPDTMAHISNAIICTSWSKSLSLAGDRIGYLAVSPRCEDFDRLIDAVPFCNRTLGFVNAPAFFQRVVEKAIHARVDIKKYEERRDLLLGVLRDAGFEVNCPAGGIYLFPRSPIEDDVAFAQACAKHNVTLVPGTGFGFPGYVRLCFATSRETILGSARAFRIIGREFGLN